MSTFRNELFEIGLAEILAQDSTGEVPEATMRAEGTSWNLLLSGGSAMGAEVYYQLVQRFNGCWLETSRFDQLSRWVADRYGLRRFAASAGVVTLKFTRTDTSAELTIPAGTVVSDVDGTVRFTTDVDLVLAIGVATGTVEATSTGAGRDQRAEAGKLTVIEGTKPQADLVVTNDEKAAGGNDEETDAEFKGRARGVWVNARRGTLSAIRQGAFQISQARNVAVYEYLHANGQQTGVTGVVVSDASGNCNAALIAIVEQELESWRSASVQVVVSSAVPRFESIDVTPWYLSGAATPAVKRLIQQTIVARVNQLVANGASSADEAPEDSWLTPGLVEGAARSVTGVGGITAITLPSGVIKPGPNERIMTNLGLVNVG